MRLAVHRAFEVPVGVEAAWAHLARLTAGTVGVIRLTNGIRSRFRMTELDRPRAWTWEGGFLWLKVRYVHAFEVLGPGRTRIRFDVHLAGFGHATLGRLFACIYGRNLDKAIPNLVAELGG